MMLFGNVLTEGVKSFKQFCLSKSAITYVHDPMQAVVYKPVGFDVSVLNYSFCFTADEI